MNKHSEEALVTDNNDISGDNTNNSNDNDSRGDPHCYECRVKYRDPTPKDLIMYLHALSYQVFIRFFNCCINDLK